MDRMKTRKRLYDSMLGEHLAVHRQMAFITGPRQVGKTTTCRSMAGMNVNWDDPADRAVVLQGPSGVAQRLGLDRPSKTMPTVLFDELHRFSRWQQFLKAFSDAYGDQVRILTTTSSGVDVYGRGVNGLEGRYYLFRMHPFTIAELMQHDPPDSEDVVRLPMKISDRDFQALWTHGGHPEPFVKRDNRFSRRWRSLRHQQLLREDARDLTQVHQLDQLELLVNLLMARSAHQIIYSSLAAAVQVSVDTMRRWIATLCDLHLGFLVRPWYESVPRSLRKEPKWFLRDWSTVDDPGDRLETFVACHLLKAVEGWTDMGLGDFRLGYLRDKNRREVGFVVVRDGKPWFLVEPKHTEEKLSPSLKYFQQQLDIPFAFQIVMEADYVHTDCFAAKQQPVAVPARTFLSQLL